MPASRLDFTKANKVTVLCICFSITHDNYNNACY